MPQPGDNSTKHFHFIGICGTAMGSVAAAMRERGYTVSGSDENVYPPMSTFLEEKGVEISAGYRPENIPEAADVVVIGNAMSRGNAEVEAVLDRKLLYTSLPEVLKTEFLRGRRNLVVTGTHGKTTTSSMLAHLLKYNGRDPSHMIGGIPRDLGQGGRFTDSEFFVIEGDEYDTAFFDKRSKFVHYLPEVVIVNNVEFDHADIFDDLDAIKLSFRRMLNIVPRGGRVFVNGDDANSIDVAEGCPAPVVTVGFGDGCDLRITDVSYLPNRSKFALGGASYEISMNGEFNVRNAAMAVAAAGFVGLDEAEIRDALAAFSGIARRQELRGEVRGVKVIDDFGHHPTAIRGTLAAIRQRHPEGRIWALFEPRSNTSRRNLMQAELAEALSAADGVIVCSVADAGKVPDGQLLDVGAVVDVVAGAGKAAYQEKDATAIVDRLAPLAEEGDVVVVLSNGGFGGIHEKLLAALAAG
jgi:UDP-N-acetylmuramate: L-alanyl-gamma-D-glutamyl-meso-diaminopimelate ligase